MDNYVYYCKECGKLYFPNSTALRWSQDCSFCGGMVLRSNLKKNTYNYMIEHNQWNAQDYKTFFPMAPANGFINSTQTAQFTPKCPTCGCTNIRRISATEKAVNIGMFGLLGNKRKYQFECLNPACKYKW